MSVLALYLPAGLRRRGIHSRKKKSHSPEGPHVQRWGVTRWGGGSLSGLVEVLPPAHLPQDAGSEGIVVLPAAPLQPQRLLQLPAVRAQEGVVGPLLAQRRGALRGGGQRSASPSPPSPLSTVTKRAMAGRGGPHRAPLLLPLLRGPEQLLLQRGVVQLQQAGEAQALQCVLVAWGQRLSITPWRWKGAIWGF